MPEVLSEVSRFSGVEANSMHRTKALRCMGYNV